MYLRVVIFKCINLTHISLALHMQWPDSAVPPTLAHALLSAFSPSSCTVLLLQCFLFKHNHMYFNITRWVYFRERKTPIATTSFKSKYYHWVDKFNQLIAVCEMLQWCNERERDEKLLCNK